MSEREAKEDLPVITQMPIVSSETWEALCVEMKQKEKFFLSLGADLVRENPQHRKSYEETLRNGNSPSEIPDVTNAVALLIWRALDIQAKRDGYQLPEIPNPVNPLSALVEFIPQIRSKEWELDLIDIAYNEILRTNPVIGEIVNVIAEVIAPDKIFRVSPEMQGKQGAVHLFYGVKSAMTK